MGAAVRTGPPGTAESDQESQISELEPMVIKIMALLQSYPEAEVACVALQNAVNTLQGLLNSQEVRGCWFRWDVRSVCHMSAR